MLYAKLAECVLLAVALVVIARVQGTLLSLVMPGQANWALHASIGELVEGVFRRFVVFVGAGIYEELLFRLVMFSVAAWLLRLSGCGSNLSLAGAALATSLLFAGAHHLGPMGEPFLWYTFLFRTTAGLFFATLFICRGFGVAAGTHAMYDVLVGLF